MSRSGMPTHNATCERLIRTLKQGEVYLQRLRREAGRDGEDLIDEATSWLAREPAPRSRSVMLVARRE